MIRAALASLALIVPLSAFAAEPSPAAMAPSPSGAPGAATVAEARMLMERAKQEIAQEEKTWSEETAREKEAETRRKQRFSEFTQDRLRLQQTLAEQELKLKAIMAKMEGHQFRERELAARFKQLGNVLMAKARELRPVLAAGLPYRLDKRLESVDLLIRDVEGGNISPEEAMNRLWTLEQNERRLSQEAEVYSGDFSEDAGDPVQVKYLRVGKQLMAFSSLDGSKLGMLRLAPDTVTVTPGAAPAASSAPAPAPRYVWVREKDMDRQTREAIKTAISTAEGKALPGFVPMPVWKNAFAERVAMAPAPVVATSTAAKAVKAGAK